MYKHYKKTRLEKSKRPILWAKRKIILIITAFMVGMSNGLSESGTIINGNKNHTEKQHKKE